jgi:hypothetical protein
LASYLRSVRTDRMNRRVHEALAAVDHQNSFHVYNDAGVHHGTYRSLDEARGCVSFDGMRRYSIVKGDWNLIEEAA